MLRLAVMFVTLFQRPGNSSREDGPAQLSVVIECRSELPSDTSNMKASPGKNHCRNGSEPSTAVSTSKTAKGDSVGRWACAEIEHRTSHTLRRLGNEPMGYGIQAPEPLRYAEHPMQMASSASVFPVAFPSSPPCKTVAGPYAKPEIPEFQFA